MGKQEISIITNIIMEVFTLVGTVYALGWVMGIILYILLLGIVFTVEEV